MGVGMAVRTPSCLPCPVRLGLLAGGVCVLPVADAQHGTDYALKSGAQMNGMRKMIAAIAGKTDDDSVASI